MLGSVARVVLTGELGRLADQLEYAPAAEPIAPGPPRRGAAPSELQIAPPASDLEYFNGIGGFAEDGREYVVIIGPGQSTPAPWVNVIANPGFGFQVSADGGGYSWAKNSRERQITPWSNDPVTDQPSQVFYLRDDETRRGVDPDGLRRSATRRATYIARHGFGYTRFEHASRGLALTCSSMSRRTIRCGSRGSRSATPRASAGGSRSRPISSGALGASRESSAPHVATKLDPATGAILASTRWNPVYADRVAFADLGGRQSAWTGDRREFLGRNGGLASPFALRERAPLSGRLGAGLDPCCALQVTLDLAPRAVVEVPCLLGDAENEAQASQLVAAYRKADLDQRPRRGAAPLGRDPRRRSGQDAGPVDGPDAERLAALSDRRRAALGPGRLLPGERRLRVPRPAAGRHGADGVSPVDGPRSADARGGAAVRRRRRAALVAARHGPGRAHAHLGRPPLAAVRRRPLRRHDRRCGTCSTSASPSSRDLSSRPTRPSASSRPTAARGPASLYEHCVRALDASLAVGAHGLPLIGGGDWNDGMNRVGRDGPRRERLAGLVPHRQPSAVRACSRTPAAKPIARRAGGRTRTRSRPPRNDAGLGRRLVSARLVRRRRAAGLGRQRRVPDRLDRPVLGGALRRRRPRARGARDGGGGPRADPAAGWPGAAVHPAVRPRAARSRLHQGLSARACARTAASTPTPPSGR